MAIQTDTGTCPTFEARARRGVSQSCLYCGGERLSLLYEGVRDRLRYVNGIWTFLRCEECGSAVISPFPHAAELPGFYPPTYSFTPRMGAMSRWKRLLASLEYRLIYRIMYTCDARRVLRHTVGKRIPRKSLLDIGCGRGHRLQEFQRLGCHVEGADFQPEVAEYVNRELGIRTCCCGIEDIGRHFAPSSFDLVTAFYVVEHVLDVRQMLRSCFLLLKPGGWFAAAVPLSDSLQAAAFGPRWSQVTEAPRHISLPSRGGIRSALQQAGFTGIRVFADSAASSASAVALSLVPSGTACASYGKFRRWGILQRLVAVVTALLAVPGCIFESQIARRPGMAIVLGRRPTDDGEVA